MLGGVRFRGVLSLTTATGTLDPAVSSRHLEAGRRAEKGAVVSAPEPTATGKDS